MSTSANVKTAAPPASTKPLYDGPAETYRVGGDEVVSTVIELAVTREGASSA
jgi:hypothetical protein